MGKAKKKIDLFMAKENLPPVPRFGELPPLPTFEEKVERELPPSPPNLALIKQKKEEIQGIEVRLLKTRKKKKKLDEEISQRRQEKKKSEGVLKVLNFDIQGREKQLKKNQKSILKTENEILELRQRKKELLENIAKHRSNFEKIQRKSQELGDYLDLLTHEVDGYQVKKDNQDSEYEARKKFIRRELRDRHSKLKRLGYSLADERKRFQELLTKTGLENKKLIEEKKALNYAQESIAKLNKEISSLEYDRWKVRRDKYSLEDQIESLEKGREELVSNRVQLRELICKDEAEFKNLKNLERKKQAELKKAKNHHKREIKNFKRQKKRFQTSKKEALEVFNQVQTRCFKMEKELALYHGRIEKLKENHSQAKERTETLMGEVIFLEKTYEEKSAKKKEIEANLRQDYRLAQQVKQSVFNQKREIEKNQEALRKLEAKVTKNLRKKREEINLLAKRQVSLEKNLQELNFQNVKSSEKFFLAKESYQKLLGEHHAILDSIEVEKQRLVECQKEHEKRVRDYTLFEKEEKESLEQEVEERKGKLLQHFSNLEKEKQEAFNAMIEANTEKAEKILYEAQSKRDALFKQMKLEGLSEQKKIIEEGKRQNEKLKEELYKKVDGKYRDCIHSLQHVMRTKTGWSDAQVNDFIEEALEASPVAEKKRHVFSNSRSVRHFYIGMTTALTLFVSVIAFRMIAPESYKSSLAYLEKTFLDKDGKSAEEALRLVKAKRLAELYIPEKNTQLKDTNWENVLFTEGFVTKWLENEAFEKSYVLELTDFFNFVLRIDDMSVIEVMREEKEYIRHISLEAQKVKLKDKEIFLASLKKQEENFKSKLTNILGDEKALETYLRFKKRYQLELLNE